MKLPLPCLLGSGLLFSLPLWGASVPEPWTQPVAQIKAVGAEGKGNAAASAAWQQLSRARADLIPPLLESMDGANDYALNWLRSAIETIAQREATAVVPLTARLEKFLRDTAHHPRARRLAYELIARADATRARSILPDFLNDPGSELRREAVQQLTDRATDKVATDKAAALDDFRRALRVAREADQIEAIAKQMGDLGEKPDLQKTFGWVTRWKVVGPFDNLGGVGFEKAFGPEQGVDFGAEVDAKDGKARWRDYETKSEYGLVDLNQPLTALKSVAGYAAAEFWSDTAQTAEIRLGCKNGWKVWLNGKFLFGRDEYHRGVEIDQYRLPVQLQAGRNVILVKCLQNEQTEDWTKEWEFQLRVTDSLGTPVISAK